MCQSSHLSLSSSHPNRDSLSASATAPAEVHLVDSNPSSVFKLPTPYVACWFQFSIRRYPLINHHPISTNSWIITDVSLSLEPAITPEPRRFNPSPPHLIPQRLRHSPNPTLPLGIQSLRHSPLTQHPWTYLRHFLGPSTPLPISSGHRSLAGHPGFLITALDFWSAVFSYLARWRFV